MTQGPVRLHLCIQGCVQGVGFRPHVHRLAQSLELTGWVRNQADGVEVELQGNALSLDVFISALPKGLPPLARLDHLVRSNRVPLDGESGFVIQPSQTGGVHFGPMADGAMCPQCLREMFDPHDRRYRHAFTHCTHCGPRYTMLDALPYDRARTSMQVFTPCAACQAEYEDPADRRFHAQANACPDCGPRLALLNPYGQPVEADDPVAEAAAWLAEGRILALKGVGGYQLLCNARDAAAVARLRARKHRGEQPLGVMLVNTASLDGLARVEPPQRAWLEDWTRPLVLLEQTTDTETALPGVAPHLPWLAAMLPCAPVHYLLFHALAGQPPGTAWLQQPQPVVLVCTSGNLHGEPLFIDDAQALEGLASVADGFLVHDRVIRQRCDDSVLRVTDGGITMIRRARGLSPAPITLPREGPTALATGALLKNTLCITRGRQALMSPHVGDLDHDGTCRALETLAQWWLERLDETPAVVACDMHPDFYSTRLASRLAAEWSVPLLAVQHHHAHLAAVQAEHGLERPILGLAIDGYGLGTDGGAWGGELMLLEGQDFQRVGHLRSLALPGGDRAAVEPWRMAAAVLHALGRGEEIPERFARYPQAQGVEMLLSCGSLCPRTTSLGRLFDAAAGLLGVVDFNGYEGEAAMRLEGLATRHGPAEALPGGWELDRDVLDFWPLLACLAGGRISATEAAAVFHATVARGLAEWTISRARHLGLEEVVVSGGCCLNQILMRDLRRLLAGAGLRVYEPRRLPPNDGGLSLGQAWVALQAVRG